MQNLTKSANVLQDLIKPLDRSTMPENVIFTTFYKINLLFLSLSTIQCLLLHPKFQYSSSMQTLRKALGPLTMTWWLCSPYKYPTTPLELNANPNALHALVGVLLFFKTVDWSFADGPFYTRAFKRVNGVAQWEREITPKSSNQKDGALEIAGWTLYNFISLRGYDLSWGIPGAMGNNRTPRETALEMLRLSMIFLPSMAFNVLAFKTPSKSPVDTLISFGVPSFPGINLFANALLAITYGLGTCYFLEIQNCALVLANYLIYPLTQIIGLPTGICNFFDPARWPPVIGSIFNLSSLAYFWGKAWHQLFRRGFLVAGGKPAARLAKSFTSSPLLQKAVGLLGVFAISGFFHEYPVYVITQKPLANFDTLPSVFLFFFVQAFGIMIEPFIIPHIPKCLGGGKLWTLTFLLVTSPLYVEPYQKQGGFFDLLHSSGMMAKRQAAA